MENTLRTRSLVLLSALLLLTHRVQPSRAQAPTPPTHAERIAGLEGANKPRQTAGFGLLQERDARQAAQTTAVAAAESLSAAQHSSQAAVSDDAAFTGQIVLQSYDAAQNIIAVDAAVQPISVRAGELITYTYYYTNTSGTTQSGVLTKIQWTQMKSQDSTSPIETTLQQFCANVCEPVNVIGPAISAGTTDGFGNNRQYAIGTLNAGQSGQFSIVLKLRRNIYPKTAEPPTRPASSIEAYTGNSLSNKVAEDTVSALVTGPVLSIIKAVASGQPAKLTIGDTVDFTITVGNATQPGDIVDNQARADAIAATDVVIYDDVPVGAEYVPTADDPPGVSRNFDTSAQRIIWSISTLAVRESKTLRMRFRKSNTVIASVINGCSEMRNEVYRATANEYPLDNSSNRYEISGQPVGIPVVPALQLRTMRVISQPISFGAESEVQFVVANHYNIASTGAQMTVKFPNTVGYVPGTAVPGTISAPGSFQPGAQAVWTFNIGPGSAVDPALVTMTLRVRAAFINPLPNPALNIPIYESIKTTFAVPSSNLPTNCFVESSDSIQTQSRLGIELVTVPSFSPYLIERSKPITFEIRVTNRSNDLINSGVVTGELPFSIDYPADYGYIAGSARVNGAPREPDRVVNGNNGYFAWDNMSFPPNSVTQLRFLLQPGGFDYVDYCLQAAAASPQDAEVRTGINTGSSLSFGGNGVCKKINPPFELEKTPDRAIVLDPYTLEGREVTFTLALTNTGDVAYEAGLLDLLGDFEYVRSVSSYGQDPEHILLNNRLRWPLVTLAPGQSLRARIVARVPYACSRGSYDNEIGFRFTSQGQTYDVVRNPPQRVTVPCSNVLLYSKSVEQATIGLYDRAKYQIRFENQSAQIANTILVTDLLPAGFTFDRMDSQSVLRTSPAISAGPDGRQMLRWTLNSVPAKGVSNIIYTARSGNVIGRFENWAWASSPGNALLRCQSFVGNSCFDYTAPEGVIPVSVAPVSVEPLATLEPSLNDSSCALPGTERSYRLALVNTNVHAYTNTTVRLRVPFGLKVKSVTTSGSSGISTLPSVTTDTQGDTVITLTGINLPAKPTGQVNAQILIFVTLTFGQIFGDVPLIAEASSDDGGILKKDDVLDPIIKRCPVDGAHLLKDANKSIVRNGDDLVYQLTLLNGTDAAYTVSLRDPLPEVFDYMETLAGPQPTVNGRELSWASVTVPAATASGPGSRVLRFKVRTNDSGADRNAYVNEARLLGSATSSNGDVPVDVSLASIAAEFQVPPRVLLPFVPRAR